MTEVREDFADPAFIQLTEIAALVDAGRVKPIVSTVLPLAEAGAAHELMERGHARQARSPCAWLRNNKTLAIVGAGAGLGLSIAKIALS